MTDVQLANDNYTLSALRLISLGARPDRRCDGHLLQVTNQFISIFMLQAA
jgi:hypothetical protein